MRPASFLVIVIAALLPLACASPENRLDDTIDAQQAAYLDASRSEHMARVDWEPVRRFAFDSPDVLKEMRVIAGQWEVRDGALHAVEGEGNRTILLTPGRWSRVRIAFDVILHGDADGQVGDIGVRLNADPETGAFNRGYAVILAQYRNQASVFYRRNVPYARTEWSPITPGERHHIAIEWTGRHMRAWVDDRVVLDAWDRGEPLPVGGPQADAQDERPTWLGLHTWNTHMELTNLTIYSDRGMSAGP